MFNSVRVPYVFTIVSLFYPVYSHDSSHFSSNIIFYRLVDHILTEEELDLEDFFESAVW
jgi:hypothetical protein